MDVVDAEQAKIAEDAGAVAVMALERVPADIRRDGGVARMSDPALIEAIQAAVTVPVMAKARIGHFAEAQVLEALEVDYIDESRGADARRRGAPHRQVGLPDPLCLRCDESRRGAPPHQRGRRDDPLEGRGGDRERSRSRAALAVDPRGHREDHDGRLRRAVWVGEAVAGSDRPRRGGGGNRPAPGPAVLCRWARDASRRRPRHAARRARPCSSARGSSRATTRREGRVPSSRRRLTSRTRRSSPRSQRASDKLWPARRSPPSR